MKQHFYSILGFLLLFSVIQKVNAQQIDSMMAVYADRYPTEKMHIQFDKNLYNKEETIWYKIYILSGTELSQLSKNVYVEWYDTSGKMIKQTVAPLYQATAKGSFDIPANYTGNFIHVKAFTRWMLNDDPAFLFERELAVNSSTLPVKTPSAPVIYKTRVETFPESGFLIEGLTSRVAFKATNQFGNPVYIKGVLTDNKNLVLDSLKVKHDGMGSFLLTPEPTESYKLRWTDENGKTGITEIQAAKKEGAKLAIRTTNDKALVQVQRTGNVTDNFKHMNLLVHMNQNLFYKVSLNASEKEVLNAQIPIDNLPTGILQFSLFTSDWIPVAERIIFVNNHMHEFNAKLTPALVNLGKRGRNVFEIYVTDTAVTNMSIAVTDASISTPDKYSIYSDILLSSELKGKIYNPAYYLTSDADSVTANLDLVMLTNGWRRFDWEKIKTGFMPELKYPRETDLMKVSGKVFGVNTISTRDPLLLNVIIAGKDSSKHFAFIPVQKDGSFEQSGLYFFDTAKIYYGFNGHSKLTDVTQVQFDNGLLKQTLKTIKYSNNDHVSPLSDSLAKAKMDYLLNEQELLKKNMASATLQEVIVKSRTKSKEQILDERYSSGLFSGGDAQTFDLTDNPSSYGALDIISFLQGRVAGLIISGSGANMTMSWRGATPDLFVNEAPSDMSMVQSINVSDIAMVKVFRPPFFGSIGGGSGGAVAIYTKKGNDATKGDPNSKGLEYTVLGGYSRFKEFFSPNYEKPSDSFEQDMRSTLYWNPYIITTKKSPRYKVEFYNNDLTKKFLVVLEGVNSDGKMTRTVKLIE